MVRTRTTRPSTAAPVKPIRTMTGPSGPNASNAVPVESPKPRGPKPVLLNVTEACDLLGISARSWRRYRARGGPLSHLVPQKTPKGAKGLFFLKRDVVASKRDVMRFVKAQTKQGPAASSMVPATVVTPEKAKPQGPTQAQDEGK